MNDLKIIENRQKLERLVDVVDDKSVTDALDNVAKARDIIAENYKTPERQYYSVVLFNLTKVSDLLNHVMRSRQAIEEMLKENVALRHNNERLKKTIALAAHCLLKEENGAICDTIWMPENRGGLCGITLYDHLCCEIDDLVELTGDVDSDAEKLKALGESQDPERISE